MRRQCHLTGGALSSVLAIHIPLRQHKFMFLVVKTHEEGEAIRQNQALLEKTFPALIHGIEPENLYIVPTAISVDELKQRMKQGHGTLDLISQFDKPRDQVESWKRETGLNIIRAQWKHKQIWLTLHDREQAEEAVAPGKFYTLNGIPTTFV